MTGTEAQARTAAGSALAARWRVSLVLLLAFGVTTFGLHVLLAELTWWLLLVLVCGLVLGSAAVVRSISSHRLLPPLAAAGMLVASLTVFFGAGSAVLGVVPTGHTWERLGSLAASGVQSINQQSVPANADVGILFLMCVGVGAMAVLGDLLANTYYSPALAGLPLLFILAVPAVTGIDLTDGFVFVLAAAAYLWLLRSDRAPGQAGRALALGAAMVVGALVIPVLLPAVAETHSGSPSGGFLSGVNPTVNLGADLRQGAVRTALTYTTDSGTGNYLRLVTLQNFTGKSWEPDKVTIDRNHTINAFGPPPGLAPDVPTTHDTTRISIAALDSPWLPVPYPSTRVTGLSGQWYWDSAALTVSSPNGVTVRGEEYAVRSLQLDPTPQQLTEAGNTVPGELKRYLELPAELPPIISSTARKVAADSASNYEKALALQEFFRGGDFSYSETAPVAEDYDGTGMAVIAKFLELKSGYCIHFASAMAVMARSLGIPARMAVGFLPGDLTSAQRDGRSVFVVTSHELHTWPELYFDGVGWVRFEPTVSRGDVPAYALQGLAGVPVPPPPATVDPSPAAAAPGSRIAPEQKLAASDVASNPTTAGMTVSLWLLFALAAAAMLLLIPAMVRGAQRGLRLFRFGRGDLPASVAWAEILQSAADLGAGIPGTATPREATHRLAGVAGLTEQTNGPLHRMLEAVEREGYARPAPGTPSGVSARDARRVIGQLAARATRRARLRARLLPPSLWGRFSRGRQLPTSAAIPRVLAAEEANSR